MKVIAKSLLMVAAIITLPAAGSSQEFRLPFLQNAPTTQYPPVALTSSISGDVDLLIDIRDGRVSKVHVLRGPRSLIGATRKNVESWQFIDQAPKSLYFTFHYQIQGVPTCGVEQPKIMFVPPSKVIVSARPIMTCDP
jgi:hypothetical protein